ncbi:hypothetical protein OF377_01220 [Ureaplasma sp. ES3154-GEN]|uniref:Vmc-like lipoprotein signal peptide domain-containing protein n=1 Tax=Ureaplasma sp. ES3154-GEN TaxID=2984844 RepID=UPI0021E85DEC|nr:hypothetical protein [Ureaplasma sp. ES3154-GEN]MCV3743507.1 hypothetical protein [Ureaplasma sp. ES3154-GEN]
MLKNKTKRILLATFSLVLTAGVITTIAASCKEKNRFSGPSSGFYLSADGKVKTFALGNESPTPHIFYDKETKMFAETAKSESSENRTYVSLVKNEDEWNNLTTSSKDQLAKIFDYKFDPDYPRNYRDVVESIQWKLKKDFVINWQNQSVIVLDSIVNDWKEGIIGNSTAGLNIKNYTLENNKLVVNFDFKPQVKVNDSGLSINVYWETTKIFFIIVDKKNISLDQLEVEFVVDNVKSVIKKGQ